MRRNMGVDLKKSDEPNEKNVLNNMVDDRKFIPVWTAIFFMAFVHIGGLYGIYLAFTSAHRYTILFNTVCSSFATFGITAGVHRLWAHRSYKANLPLRMILLVLATLNYQGNVVHWVRDHRTHHKNSDTPADPHNFNYGFMYAHIGWLLRKKSPIVVLAGSKVDLSDLYEDPVIVFQEKHKMLFVPFVSLVLPTIIPMYFWGEGFSNAFFVDIFRYLLALHFTMCINSLAHYAGQKPYDANIKPSENTICSLLTSGEGFHNYHHTFPWDYKAAELGNNFLNPTTTFINFFAKIGWAYELKTVSEEMVRKRCARTGAVVDIWGWGDKDQQKEDVDGAVIKYKTN